MMWHEIFYAVFITLSIGYIGSMVIYLTVEAYKHYKQIKDPKLILFSVYVIVLLLCGFTAIILKKLGI
jgi:hypothetical protein